MFDILIRLELLDARAFWRVAVRDVVFMIAVAAGVAIVVACLLNLYHLAAHGLPPALAMGLSALIGAGLFASLYPNARSGALTGLTDGPFFALVADRKSLGRWLALRTTIVFAPVVLFAAVVFAFGSPLGAAGFLVAALAGGALAAAFWVRSATPAAAGRSGPGQPTSRQPMGVLARAISAGALLALGTLAAATAAHNNDSPAIGVALATAAAFIGALILAPSGPVTVFAAREPRPLVQLYWRLHGKALAFAALGGIAAGLIARLGVVGGIEVGFNAAVLGGLFFVFLYLHRLNRSLRHVPLSLAGEACGAMLIAVDGLTSLGVVWLLIRLIFLTRAARRLRWLDR